tara:strand:+ start:821 stop:1198 length:378 start_codon:yes stop_codon:yes gene_type:complete
MMKSEELVKFNGECADPQIIWDEACKAGIAAVDAFTAKHGEPMYCGFGSVNIYPARGHFVKFLKQNEIGRNGYPKGWSFSYYAVMPKDHPFRHTQSLDIKEECVNAVANVLQSFGLKAYGVGRAD